MKKILKGAEAKSILIIITALFVFLSFWVFTTSAFAEIRYKDPGETKLQQILAKPNKSAVQAAKAQQLFTFKMGKTTLAGCLVCHSDKYLVKVERSGKKRSLFVDPKKFAKSVHAEVGCVGCHVGWGLQAHKPPMTDNWQAVARMACKNCHTYQYTNYSKSLHFQALKEGRKYEERDKHPPTCFDCHGNHDIVKVKDERSPVAARNAPEEVCGKCHEHQLETYLDNYHGKTRVFLNNERTPSCFECHSNHNIKNLKNKDDAVAACKRCHKTANETLVRGFDIHADENNYKAAPVLFIAKWAMIGLLVGVFAFFYPHTLLLLRRQLIDRKKHKH